MAGGPVDGVCSLFVAFFEFLQFPLEKGSSVVAVWFASNGGGWPNVLGEEVPVDILLFLVVVVWWIIGCCSCCCCPCGRGCCSGGGGGWLVVTQLVGRYVLVVVGQFYSQSCLLALLIKMLVSRLRLCDEHPLVSDGDWSFGQRGCFTFYITHLWVGALSVRGYR